MVARAQTLVKISRIGYLRANVHILLDQVIQASAASMDVIAGSLGLNPIKIASTIVQPSGRSTVHQIARQKPGRRWTAQAKS